jgi:ribosome maturation factor RimP
LPRRVDLRRGNGTVNIDPKLSRVWEVAEPIALEAGLELVDVEHRREGHGTVLRLLIDRPGGVSLDELTAVSRQVSDVLDAHTDVVPGAYTLEVSSPGVNRPLTRPAHFEAYRGKRVHVRTRAPIGDRHSFRGVLAEVTPSEIVVTGDDQQRHTIPFEEIAHANYQHEFPSPAKAPGRRGLGRGARRSATR